MDEREQAEAEAAETTERLSVSLSQALRVLCVPRG